MTTAMTKTMNDQNAIQLLPPIDFRGRRLALVGYDNEPYVPMKPFVEAMGLAWPPQYTKLLESAERFCVTVIVMQLSSDTQKREVTCIPLSRLPAWMETLQVTRIRNPKAIEVIKTFQAESDAVLWNHWEQGSARPIVEPLKPPAPPCTQAELSLRLAITLVDHEKILNNLTETVTKFGVWQAELVGVLNENFKEANEHFDNIDKQIGEALKRVDTLEDIYETARRTICRLDEADGTPQCLTDRQKILIIVENYTKAYTAGDRSDYQKTWTELYNYYLKKEHVNPGYQAKKYGMKTLDFIEGCSKMSSLLELARCYFAEPLIKGKGLPRKIAVN
jgi:flavodoxin